MEKLNKNWSEEIQKLTLKKLDVMSCVKNYKEPFNGCVSKLDHGMVVISNVEVKNYFPLPGDKVLAEYESIEDMIKDGWVID